MRLPRKQLSFWGVRGNKRQAHPHRRPRGFLSDRCGFTFYTHGTYDCPEGRVGEEAVRVRTADKAGLVGKRLQVHNSAWVPGTGTGAWGSDATTSCHVVGECVAPMERDGLPSCHAYVVEARDDRLYYQVPASLIQQPKRHRRR